MSNVSEIGQNELASASYISQNEAPSEVSERSSPQLQRSQRCCTIKEDTMDDVF